MNSTKSEAMQILINNPIAIGHELGFKDLGEIHNKWIHSMICEKEDRTLLAHRGSFKTTTVSLSIAIIIVLMPSKKILFMRKTDTDVVEVVTQVKKILLSEVMQNICHLLHGTEIILTTDSKSQIDTNLNTSTSGAVQLQGLGIGASITGKHADFIFTDDIVNLEDRYSRAERERTKRHYQELENVKNRGGRIFNTGTPWHEDDCISVLMPNKCMYDCYTTGLMSEEKLEELKSKMTPSLFSANYELKHIADEDLIFTNPKTNADPLLASQGYLHIDAAYGGEDFTAMTICKRRNDKYYVFGKCWKKNVQDVEDEIVLYHEQFNTGKGRCESNADKGFLAKELKEKGLRISTYHESMNKHVKITTYLKREWENVVFVEGTDKEYIDMICDYNENAEHDDCPDSLASMLQWYSKKASKEYEPIIY